MLGLAAALVIAAPAHAITITDHSVYSPAMRGTMHYSIYLPAGYSKSHKHYPVIYFLHGLPSNSKQVHHIWWVASAMLKTNHRAIIVGAQGARGKDSDPEWLDWGPGRNWETWVKRDLRRAIDKRYRTIANRRGRVIVGVSAGGYGAALIGFHNPDEYTAIQSWSGYFEPTNPAGTRVLDLGSRRANNYANLHKQVPHMHSVLGKYYRSTYFSFYIGTGDSRFLNDNRRLAQQMYKYSVPHNYFRTYSGAHSTALWRAEAPAWINRALKQAAKPQ